MSEAVLRQRLAAILAADAAAYSRLMAADEVATVGLLDAARAVFRERIEANRGRVVDTAGDSVLAIFDTAAGAVTAALGHLGGEKGASDALAGLLERKPEFSCRHAEEHLFYLERREQLERYLDGLCAAGAPG